MVAVMLTVPLAAVTVASSVNVTMPPGGSVGTDEAGLDLSDGRTARAHRATAGGAGEGRLLQPRAAASRDDRTFGRARADVGDDDRVCWWIPRP